MRPRTIAILGALSALAAALVIGGALAGIKGPAGSAQAASGDLSQPLLILYWEESFQGRSLEVTGTLPDLPVVKDEFGNELNWNDEVRSIVVASGTWRIFAGGRCGTELDDTPLESLDLSTKKRVPGWSTLLSATSAGPLAIPSEAAGGFYRDISSVELVSEENLPDWASPLLGRK